MNFFRTTLCVFICALLCVTPISVSGYTPDALDAAFLRTAEYLQTAVSSPTVGSVGGEWAVIGLARSGEDINDGYFDKYYSAVQAYVREKNGILHKTKYTEYSRVILALTAIGKDPANVGGYDLTEPLGDYEQTVKQGVNGAIWALIALDSGNYPMPKNDSANVQATRRMYVDKILSGQLSDGGWSLLSGTASAYGSVSDPDITGMALQALSKYMDDPAVKAAADKAVGLMSKMQEADGGFSSSGSKNSESCAQMLVALCELSIPIDDPRFVKNGNTLIDVLLSYGVGNGMFRHVPDGKGDLMATEQCFYALAAAKRSLLSQNSLYDMSDAETRTDQSNAGLSGKHDDVKINPAIYSGRTFADITYHDSRAAIEALAARGVINGKSDSIFDPEGSMTRAEFCAIIVRGLGLPEKGNTSFSDVSRTDWFYSAVNTAAHYGIIKGVSETIFAPNGTITREQAMVMLARAASLCGMDIQLLSYEARDILSEYTDYMKLSEWAMSSCAFCYREKMIPYSSDIDIQPQKTVTRAEIAEMLYRMLDRACLV